MVLLDKAKPHVQELFRIVVGLLFTLHGTATLFSFMGSPRSGSAPDIGAWPGWWAAMIQLIAGALVLVGLGTRIAALLCSGSMAYAYFVAHQPQDLSPLTNGGELSALFCWAFLLIAVVGPGRYALDTAIAKYRSAAARESDDAYLAPA
ncbi:DoxX family protein [Actinokineospora guangxiensis]|uniref:DoxX family protein n=1 Tax=Actinokineospora guangxiensis TaxID=1490288 RepID=A0ABW0EHP8_9PSEU